MCCADGDGAAGGDIRPLLALIRSAPRTAVILIDGPSGAGKSTLADRLIAAWPTDAAPQLVRLDDVYPGWGGLDRRRGAAALRPVGRTRGRATGRLAALGLGRSTPRRSGTASTLSAR